MKKETKLSNGQVVASYGLDQEQHDLAVKAIENDSNVAGGYELEEVDSETIEIWKDDADEEEYKEFLDLADDCYEVYTLNSVLGDFSQPIGEVIVY